MENYRHKISIQLRFKDVDKMGHVNNANHLTYIELARIKYLEDVMGEQIDWSEQDGLILARLEIDYKQPIYYEDKIFVYTKCSRIGKKSFELGWLIVRENNSKDNEIIARGIAIIVCYDYALKKTIEIPPGRRKKIEEYEGIILS